MSLPDARGRFGPYGGRYVPETLVAPLEDLARQYAEARADPRFQQELRGLLRDYAGRPTPLYWARRMTDDLGGGRIYFKREDLAHTGAHKINNTLGQALLAQRMGKRRVIAETGAGQHGVATATAAALFGLSCTIYMGEEDMARQALNVERMRLLGAEVIPVRSGTRTLKDATNEALRDWVTTVETTHYIIGSVVGPHPYPMMVRDFQRIIGEEVREEILAREGRLPDWIVACVGGGSNSLGIFAPFIEEERVGLVGVEAGGRGEGPGENAASLCRGHPGVLHGSLSYLLQDGEGQVAPTHSVAPGLDYPGVGPEHSYLKETGRAEYVTASDQEALEAFSYCARLEGILPALEPAHAIAHLRRLAPGTPRAALIVLCLSGRGDKDVEAISRRKDPPWR